MGLLSNVQADGTFDDWPLQNEPFPWLPPVAVPVPPMGLAPPNQPPVQPPQANPPPGGIQGPTIQQVASDYIDDSIPDEDLGPLVQAMHVNEEEFENVEDEQFETLSDDEIVCPICMERPLERVVDCGHTYCQVCVYKLNNNCAICRQRIFNIVNLDVARQENRTLYRSTEGRQHDVFGSARCLKVLPIKGAVPIKRKWNPPSVAPQIPFRNNTNTHWLVEHKQKELVNARDSVLDDDVSMCTYLQLLNQLRRMGILKFDKTYKLKQYIINKTFSKELVFHIQCIYARCKALRTRATVYKLFIEGKRYTDVSIKDNRIRFRDASTGQRYDYSTLLLLPVSSRHLSGGTDKVLDIKDKDTFSVAPGCSFTHFRTKDGEFNNIRMDMPPLSTYLRKMVEKLNNIITETIATSMNAKAGRARFRSSSGAGPSSSGDDNGAGVGGSGAGPSSSSGAGPSSSSGAVANYDEHAEVMPVFRMLQESTCKFLRPISLEPHRLKASLNYFL